ncbi:MAG TPA: DUF333 domain-containing protein [Anaerolineaceae bacterium]
MADKFLRLICGMIVIVGMILMAGACSGDQTPDLNTVPGTDSSGQIPNTPLTCAQQGGRLQLRETPLGGQVEVCVLPGG